MYLTNSYSFSGYLFPIISNTVFIIIQIVFSYVLTVEFYSSKFCIYM